MHRSIEFDGFEDIAGLRLDLLAFIEEYCRDMTLQQAREWFREAFPESEPLNLP